MFVFRTAVCSEIVATELGKPSVFAAQDDAEQRDRQNGSKRFFHTDLHRPGLSREDVVLNSEAETGFLLVVADVHLFLFARTQLLS